MRLSESLPGREIAEKCVDVTEHETSEVQRYKLRWTGSLSLETGHTHASLDQIFGLLAHAMRRVDVLVSPEDV